MTKTANRGLNRFNYPSLRSTNKTASSQTKKMMFLPSVLQWMLPAMTKHVSIMYDYCCLYYNQALQASMCCVCGCFNHVEVLSCKKFELF